MAVLGDGGTITLKREAPAAYAFAAEDWRAGSVYATVPPMGYWAGDAVFLESERGIPLQLENCPDGVGNYFGSTFQLGDNRNHIFAETDPFYIDDDLAEFYQNGTPATRYQTWVGFDSLDRASFYPSRASALQGTVDQRINFLNLDVGEMTMTSDDATMPWVWICELQGWQLNLDAPSVDTTGLSQKFGTATKSLVTGGGTFDFFMDYSGDEQSSGPQALLNLLLLIEQGAAASMELSVIRDRERTCNRLPGSLFYSLDALITQSAVNVRAVDLMTGSATFVTTGEIRLQQGVG